MATRAGLVVPGNSNSGKRPKPNALRVLEGMRGHRPLRDEPKFPPVAPVCPDWMPALGREIWEKLTDKLGRVPGWLSDSDFLVMERIGVAYARWRTYEANHYAVRVREGQVDDPTFLPVMFGIREGADYHDPAVWVECNPSLDELGLREDLAREVALSDTVPSSRPSTLRFRFCHWGREAEERLWVNLESYDACAKEPIDRAKLKGRPAWVGVDMASRFDIASVCCVVRGEAGVHHALWRSFIPRDVDRAQVPPYDQFLADGSLEATEGNTTSYKAVFDAVVGFCAEFDVREIALDPHETAHLAQELEEESIATVINVQGTCAAQNLGVKETERLIVAGLLRTGGNACARWCLRNVRIRSNSMGEVKLDKERSPEKIDLWSAAVLAIGRAVLDQEDVSVYASRGILTLDEPFR